MSNLWLPYDQVGPVYTDNPIILPADSEYNGQKVLGPSATTGYMATRSTNPKLADIFTSTPAARSSWTIFLPITITAPTAIDWDFLSTGYSIEDAAGTGAYIKMFIYRKVHSGNHALMFRGYARDDTGAATHSAYLYTWDCLGNDPTQTAAALDKKAYYAVRNNGPTNYGYLYMNGSANVDSRAAMLNASYSYTFSSTTTFTWFGDTLDDSYTALKKSGECAVFDASLSDTKLDEIFAYYKDTYGDDVIER